MRRTSASWALWLGAAAALAPNAAPAQTRTVEVVSSPPELVTIPGVLVRVRGADIDPIGWASNDTLITPFYQNEDGDWFGWIGLMDRLLEDPHQILTVVPDPRNPTAELNFSIAVHTPDQPLFPGPRPPAAPCQNEAVGFGRAADATCATGRTVRYVYRTTGGAWAALPLSASPPANVERTTTSRGKDVPMIVRVETGVVNRAPYVIALLADPTSPEPPPGKPWPMTEWNGTLVYGAGDGFGLGVQGETRAGLFDLGRPTTTKSCAEALIGQGYAIAVGQTVTGPPAYDIVAAETLLRVRERFIKWYALPRATIGMGTGEAGPALTRIAKTYPGLDAVGPAGDPGLATTAASCPQR
jgi:hypothetical protein